MVYISVVVLKTILQAHSDQEYDSWSESNQINSDSEHEYEL